MKLVSFVAENADTALAQIHRDLGPEAVVVSVRKMPPSGISRLWQRNGRLEVTAGIPQTVEMRRTYRELIVTTPGLNESIGGAILFDETIRQQTKDGIPMAEVLIKAGIIPGIKVDEHAKSMAAFPNEKITEGLDGLRERLAMYKKMGARFAKWRAVITIGEGIPTTQCIEANTHALARYAAVCQEADIVPIVEPEVLMNGNHSIQKCFDVSEQVQKILFYQLYKYRINLEGIILKPNMVIQGLESPEKNSVDEVAEATVNCLLESVPASVPAIAFYQVANLRKQPQRI